MYSAEIISIFDGDTYPYQQPQGTLEYPAGKFRADVDHTFVRESAPSAIKQLSARDQLFSVLY